MSYLINNQQHLNDVIFNGRNKSYGAYAIRSAYGNTIFKSLFIVASGFGTFMGLAYYFSHRNDVPSQKNDQLIYQDSLITTVFDMKPEEPVKNETRAETPPAGRAEPIENSIVSITDSLVVETHTVLNNMADPNITTSTTGSTGTSDLAFTSGGGAHGSGTVSGTSLPPEPAELYFVDQEPEYEGGLAALYKFISSNLKYPPIASEEGKQGTVYVKFVVNETGKVEKVNLQNNLGYGLDEEARRVVSMIPNFKSPARVKGKAVKVYFQLPIRFKLR